MVSRTERETTPYGANTSSSSSSSELKEATPKLAQIQQRCTGTKGHLADRAFRDIRQQREGPEPLNYHRSVTQLSIWRARSCANGDGQWRPQRKLFVDVLIGALTAHPIALPEAEERLG
jgi:hypothetical protein